MATHTIALPRSLDLSSIEFAQKIQFLPEADEYVIDFQELEWVEPFGMLFVSNAIQEAVEHHPNRSFNFQGARLSYAAHMGFFQALGIDFVIADNVVIVICSVTRIGSKCRAAVIKDVVFDSYIGAAVYPYTLCVNILLERTYIVNVAV